MATMQQSSKHMVSTSSQKLEDLIQTAIKKVGAKKENDLCRYIPASRGGYMHHFTMRKMKTQEPEELSHMIKTFIVDAAHPKAVAPKQRAPRGSKKKPEQITLSQNDINRIIHLARSCNDIELLRKFLPKTDLKKIKKSLISTIRQDVIDQNLWNSFSEAVVQKQSH